MISCELLGGLGNMLFQIASIEYMGYSYKFDTYYYNLLNQINYLNNDSVHNPNLKHANEYLTMFKNFDWKINSKCNAQLNLMHIPFNYVKVPAIDNTLYRGFFQCEEYFNNKEFIYKLFEPSDDIKKYLEKYTSILDDTTCSIHVRHGDYLKLNRIHHVQDLNYFNSSIDYMKNQGVKKFLIFSDNITWCKQNFTSDEFHFIEDEKDYIELFLQSKCTHNIISNSSFSWWGAWLNKNKDKKVIAPKIWFTGEKNKEAKDIIPKSWIKI